MPMKHIVWISILFGVFGAGHVGVVAAAPVPCSASDAQIAKGAQSDASGTLSAVRNFINGNDPNTKSLLVRWFGSSDGSTAAKVAAVFDRSSQWLNAVQFFCLYENDGSFTQNVVTPGGVIRVDVSGSLFAYVDPTDLGKVNLGLMFFKASGSTGYDSRLGTLIHEMTHFWITGNTNSHFNDIYPRAECLQLAQSDPGKAQGNAQNYEYFVEEWLMH